MAALLVAHGRPGFYFRVLEEGEVEAGDEIVQVAAGPERMTVGCDQCAAVHARPSTEPVGAGVAHLCAQCRLACLLPGAARSHGGAAARRPAIPGSLWSAPPPAWAGFRPLRVARKDSREQQRDLADAGAH